MTEIILEGTHIVLYATTMIGLHIWMDQVVWQYGEYFAKGSVYAIVPPSFPLAAATAVAAGLGIITSGLVCLIATVIDIAITLASIAMGWIRCIKKYRAEGNDPDYVAFFVVSGYSVFAAVLNACLLLLL